MTGPPRHKMSTFLSTLSLRRATEQSASYNAYLEISIHALLAESDVGVFSCYLDNIISIHALLAESDRLGLPGWLRVLISIHALLAESDTWQRGSRITYVISIHALLAESDFASAGWL